ncbi:MAG: 3-oxoacyl-[acyl-carrier protein] reductase [Candidatus Azotimanducaceae bacterium]|jgi:3-oxoacyl-[acyl-carrier protein] reductase
MTNENKALQNRVAIVTGASRGIGRAIALALRAQGAFVIGTATTEAGANAIDAADIGLVLNVSDKESVDQFLTKLKDYEPALILVNNAGITRDNLALRMKEEEWEDVINTNLTSIFRVTKGCLRAMTKAKWGRVINISSVVGSMGNAGQSNYAAAKAGMEGYSRALAIELGSRNITVNSIAPGFISTDMTDELPEDQRAALLTRVPAGRLGSGEEVAALVAYLASDLAGYITGETIHINGGMYMG